MTVVATTTLVVVEFAVVEFAVVEFAVVDRDGRGNGLDKRDSCGYL
ncbi:MAG TPA: hypothetical protein VG297_00180 [Bryobacteraceae bacterium]|nr:hypothetical protein [Bryobacteraceae bacterium]